MQKTLTLAIVILLSGCARAEWQETPSGRGGAQQQGQGPGEDTSKPPADPSLDLFSQCESRTLKVRIVTSKSQDGVQTFQAVIARYPSLHVTVARKTKQRSVFFLSPQSSTLQACEDETCAELAGWSQVQNELRSIEGVTVKCHRLPKVAHSVSTLSEESIF